MPSSFDEFDPYLAWLDIKPHEHPVDHYRLLGVERYESDALQIKQAADQRMGHVRSFQTGPRGRFTQKLLNDLSAAKLCLLNLATKASYDAVLRGQESADPAAAPMPPPVQEREVPIASPVSTSRDFPTAVASISEPLPPPLPEQPTANDSESPPTSFQRPRPLEPRPNSVRLLPAGLAVTLLAIVVGGTILAIVTRPADDSSQSSDGDLGERKATREKPPATPPPIADEVVIQQEANGGFHFPASLAQLHGNLQRDSAGGSIVNWTSTDEWISWSFDAARQGFFRVQLVYAANGDSADGRYVIEIGEKSKIGEVRAASPPGSDVTDEMVLLVGKKGRNQMRLRAVEVRGGELMKFRSLTLVPTGS